jgi:hypothetical protein
MEIGYNRTECWVLILNVDRRLPVSKILSHNRRWTTFMYGSVPYESRYQSRIFPTPNQSFTFWVAWVRSFKLTAFVQLTLEQDSTCTEVWKGLIRSMPYVTYGIESNLKTNAKDIDLFTALAINFPKLSNYCICWGFSACRIASQISINNSRDTIQLYGSEHKSQDFTFPLASGTVNLFDHCVSLDACSVCSCTMSTAHDDDRGIVHNSGFCHEILDWIGKK